VNKPLPKLPQLLARKIYKTGQTRGADDDVIYQNRVSRGSTVLIPYRVWELAHKPPNGEAKFAYGSITLIPPEEYFNNASAAANLKSRDLVIGTNALIFYETRAQWLAHDPEKQRWTPAEKRLPPLGGQYVARVPGNTAEGGAKILRGFTNTSNKGAGIRSYEYASAKTIDDCRLQLEALFWRCNDAMQVTAANGMEPETAKLRQDWCNSCCAERSLINQDQLVEARIVGKGGHTVCPLCLEQLSGEGFFNRVKQAEGREVTDLTVTQINLFHVQELRYGAYNHRPYNVAWGHHHCNVVVKDSGIVETLNWMNTVLARNVDLGYLASSKNGS